MVYRYFFWFLIIATLLSIGVLCYLQGDKDVAAFYWLKEVLPQLHQWLVLWGEQTPLIYRPGWIAHHLSDIMWSASFAMLICGIWVNQFTFLKLLLVGIACAIFYESLQLVGAARGTFDLWDLAYSFVAGAVGAVLTYFILNKHYTKE